MFKRKSNTKSPEIPTAALPDIIFILLFFFMITSQQKPVRDLVDATIPTEERTKKVPDTKYVVHISVGKSKDASRGSGFVIQVMDEIVSLGQIVASVDNYRQTKMTEANRGKQVIAHLNADIDANVGLIKDIEMELRKAGIYTVANITQFKK